MDIVFNHSILAISGVIFAIGIILLILANGQFGKTMRRMGFILSGFALIAFTLSYFLDVLSMNT
ncbi:TPA: hypothetical protein ACVNTL_002218 [Legionella pneumophila]|uniref:hypothetical protein n=1 Tax=Legionella erythra TaxID=448 RepID=UPI000731133C|nr:hypothetical protein [Legionella erythra]HAT6349383.1 hypothetical protein [Legionella pneumophila]HAU0381398.1 hypothetical protein [Legionella pneumophila]HAU0422401.1 hypothetical protein [Legionella pneumophila]HAU0424815.1 hypothetical protein [Legionella pneumophila]HAU0431656.1 hypothetical protein [Legionella pneumophila]